MEEKTGLRVAQRLWLISRVQSYFSWTCIYFAIHTNNFMLLKTYLINGKHLKRDFCLFVFNLFLVWGFFFFWLCHAACGISVPQPGIEPRPSAVRVQSPNHWVVKEVSKKNFNERKNPLIILLSLDFLGGPVIKKTLHSHCWGPGFNPWLGN